MHRAGRAALREVLRGGRFDVVHVHVSVFSPMAMSLTAAACAQGLPVAVTAHSMWPDSPALVQPAGTGLRLARRPVAWSAVSQVAAGPLRRALGAGVPVDVVPNAVDVAWWRARPDGVLSSPYAGEVVVTSLGRLAARKRPLALLRALRTVRELVEPDVRLRLVLAGEGRQLPRLRRAAAAWGMTDWVDLPGRLSREQSRELLQRSDVYVGARRPRVVRDRGTRGPQAVGLPVVAKACSGVGEYVGHGTEGLLVGSDHEMALAVAALVRDPAMRTRIAAHNAAVAADDHMAVRRGAHRAALPPGGRAGRADAGARAGRRVMTAPRTIVSFHAHPDDEVLLTGGTLARMAAAGHRVVLVTATSGGAGLADPASQERGLAAVRAAELDPVRAAARLRPGRAARLRGLGHGRHRGGRRRSVARRCRTPPNDWRRSSSRSRPTC